MLHLHGRHPGLLLLLIAAKAVFYCVIPSPSGFSARGLFFARLNLPERLANDGIMNPVAFHLRSRRHFHGRRDPIMASISSSRLRILVADDSRSTALAFTRLLEAKGHKVQAVLNGLAAVDAMAEFKPHIVLLDVGMPALDGHAVTRKIRKELGFEGPIVIISGHGSEEDKFLSLEAGANHHLVKPIDFDFFWALLDELAQTTVHDSEC